MIQKFFLFVILVILVFVLYLVFELSSKVSGLKLDATPKEVIMKPASSSVETKNMIFPAIWQGLEGKNVKKLFLSYDVNDFETAFEVAKMIERDGSFVSVYLPPKERTSIKGDEEMVNAIKTADAFLVLFTPNYQNSSIANQEFGISVSEEKESLVLLPFQMLPEAIKYGNEIIQITPEVKAILQETVLKMLSSKSEGSMNSPKPSFMQSSEEPKLPELKI